MPVVFVDRNPKGIGSLSEAINRGIRSIKSEFVFIVTNVTFEKNIIKPLIQALESDTKLAAVCPVYQSDHLHLRPSSEIGTVIVPFIEFTCVMVRTELLKQHPLDEDMPYVGQDIDWSYRMKCLGLEMASNKNVRISHTYIRHSLKYPVTLKRLAMRKAADAGTINKLELKYGKDWRNVLNYKAGIASR